MQREKRLHHPHDDQVDPLRPVDADAEDEAALAAHPYRGARSHFAATERRGFILLAFGLPWLALPLASMALSRAVQLEDALFCSIPLAVVAFAVVRSTRLRSVRATEKRAWVEVRDRKMTRRIRRREILIVEPRSEVTVVLATVLILLVTGLTNSMRQTWPRDELFGAAAMVLSVGGSIAFALHRRATLARVKLPGEWWGAWFERDEITRVLDRAPTNREMSSPT